MSDGHDLSEAETLQEARDICLRLLARREHSQSELIDKAVRRGISRSIATHAVKQLADSGLQSDERFAQNYVRTRLQKGYASARVAHELRCRGVLEPRQHVADFLASQSGDEFKVVSDFYLRRFGSKRPADAREFGKRMRMLQARGFSMSTINKLLSILIPSDSR